MNEGHHERDERDCQRTAELLGHAADESFGRSYTSDKAAYRWQKLLDATMVEAAGGWLSHARRWLLIPALACAGVAAALVLSRYQHEPAIHCWVDGQELSQAEVTSASLGSKHVAFSDGSSVVLQPSGFLRIREPSAHGAVLSLQHGRAEVSIQHRPAAQWTVEAGPYHVMVVGTRFIVEWDPSPGHFRLDLLQGAVQVGGPGLTSPVLLGTGQAVEASTDGGFGIGTARTSPPAQEPRVPNVAAPEPEAPRTDVQTSMSSRSRRGAAPAADARSRCDWTSLVSMGQFETVLGQARRMGLTAAFVECSSDSLFALADAARYSGDFALSHRTLAMLAKRSHEDPGKAAFFLGRLEEARGNLPQALEWYEKAGQLSPKGVYRREAQDGSVRIRRGLESPASTGIGR